ncbi:hypothetical protein QYF61_018785 [Mycteria americana]|uniref:Uncharacterized protein n=1 Tax=Mycteria americana TaxID=33587 RepID=A0AAN7P8C0_MYCAM|nr:hypothetical protein QYF61_018785 [Mycteria americana]
MKFVAKAEVAPAKHNWLQGVRFPEEPQLKPLPLLVAVVTRNWILSKANRNSLKFVAAQALENQPSAPIALRSDPPRLSQADDQTQALLPTNGQPVTQTTSTPAASSLRAYQQQKAAPLTYNLLCKLLLRFHTGADLKRLEKQRNSWGWRLNHFPGQPVPMLDNPLGEEKFPNIQSKPPPPQLEAISSCPMACYLGEETDPHLSTTSFQAVVESDEVSPQPPFLQAKQSQLPQPLLIRLLLQTLHQLRCPSLDTLQYLNIPLVVGGPKLNTVFEVRPHQCRVQGHDHFPSPAGHAIFDTSQDAIGFLGRLGTLLAHIQAAVNKHPQVLLCQAAFQLLFPKPGALHGVAVAQVQDLALGLVKPHTIHPSPSIQPVQVPL